MAKPRFNAGKVLMALAVIAAVGLVAVYVYNQLVERGLI
jgi:hypothetical protein